jgi:hypothetical protein
LVDIDELRNPEEFEDFNNNLSELVETSIRELPPRISECRLLVSVLFQHGD